MELQEIVIILAISSVFRVLSQLIWKNCQISSKQNYSKNSRSFKSFKNVASFRKPTTAILEASKFPQTLARELFKLHNCQRTNSKLHSKAPSAKHFLEKPDNKQQSDFITFRNFPKNKSSSSIRNFKKRHTAQHGKT